jgi:hypothetical protein
MQIVMQEIIFKINFYVKLQIKCTKVIGVDFQNCFFSINLKKIKFYRINDTSEFYFSVHSLTNELIVWKTRENLVLKLNVNYQKPLSLLFTKWNEFSITHQRNARGSTIHWRAKSSLPIITVRETVFWNCSWKSLHSFSPYVTCSFSITLCTGKITILHISKFTQTSSISQAAWASSLWRNSFEQTHKRPN